MKPSTAINLENFASIKSGGKVGGWVGMGDCIYITHFQQDIVVPLINKSVNISALYITKSVEL